MDENPFASPVAPDAHSLPWPTISERLRAVGGRLMTGIGLMGTARTIQLSLRWSSMTAENQHLCLIVFFVSLAVLLGGLALLLKSRQAAWGSGVAVLGLVAAIAYAAIRLGGGL